MRTKAAKRPRRQAKQQRARETVDAILEAASRVLAEEGYAAASTSRLADVAGVSIGTLYEYFENRDAVFEVLIDRELGNLVDVFGRAAAATDGPILPTLAAMIAEGMRAMPRGPALFRALEHVPGATFRTRLDAARRQVVGFIERLLEAHRGELRVTDIGRASLVAVSAVEGIAAASPDDEFDPELVREMIELLHCYLIGPLEDESP